MISTSDFDLTGNYNPGFLMKILANSRPNNSIKMICWAFLFMFKLRFLPSISMARILRRRYKRFYKLRKYKLKLKRVLSYVKFITAKDT